MERCLNHTRQVYGSSAKPYTVSRKGGTATCTCIAFAIGKNRMKSDRLDVRQGIAWCKHIEAQFDTLCWWEGDPILPGHCDECLGPTEKVEDEEG